MRSWNQGTDEAIQMTTNAVSAAPTRALSVAVGAQRANRAARGNSGGIWVVARSRAVHGIVGRQDRTRSQTAAKVGSFSFRN